MTYSFDPELAAVIPSLTVSGITDPISARRLMAQMYAALPRPDTTGVHIEDCLVTGPFGAPDVAIRIYRPKKQAAPAAIYNVHGGGFFCGDLETDHRRCVALAQRLNIVVVSVNYRLSPETPFPGPLEDAYAGLVWTANHAEELGIDVARIAIRGLSAGGGLCAGLTLLSRDRGGPRIAFQLLGVPEIDDRLATPSMVAFVDTPIWNRPNAEVSWEYYLGPGLPGSADVSPYAAPARATDLSGLPPAYISVMQYDPVRDEGVAYALALSAAGVPIELHLFPGTFHGSAMVEHAAVSQRELDEELTVLRRALELEEVG